MYVLIMWMGVDAMDGDYYNDNDDGNDSGDYTSIHIFY